MIDERVALNLDDMKRAAEEATSFVEGVTETDFLNSPQLQKACAMCLVIVGESAARVEQVSPDFVSAHPEWPWKDIRGMRNVIVHDYARLNLPRIWQTVKTSLPDLLSKIEAIGELDPRLWPKD
jgi:uncharacterized protein with HEPN domain